MLGVMNVEEAEERPVSVVRVLIVDDLDLWREFISARLREQPDVRIVGIASDGLEAVQRAEELQPDLILLDISLPKLNGLEAARQIRRLAPKSKILFISGESAPGIVGAAFSVGGSGYVSKMDLAEELLTGIEAVLDGRRFVSASLADLHDLTEARDPDFKDEQFAV
jgi:two-component system nitrate/nitrite response regulator NarL